jgi:hypothetical protein
VKRWPPLLAALLIPAAFYVASASHEPGAWDTAELQGVPYLLGIAHPTGFPLYVLLGYVWSHVVAIGSVAFRLNAFSGIAVAVIVLAGYAVAREFGAARSVALAAALWFAFTQNVWSHAARAEAQDLAIAFASVSIWCFLRWMNANGDRWFLAAFACCGLALAAHPNALWILPAFVFGALVARRRPRVALVCAAALALILPLFLYLYLPLRSAYVAAHGLDPTSGLAGVNGGIFWNYNDPRTMHGFVTELSGSQFHTPRYFWAAFNPVHAGAAASALGTGLREQFGIVATVLVALGFLVALRRNWRATVVLCIACTAGLIFSVAYPNEGDVGRYRLLTSWLAVPLLGALIPAATQRAGRIAAMLLAFGLTAGAVVAFLHNDGLLRHAPREGGRWVIEAVRPDVADGDVIVAGWLDATSLAYGAYVDGSLPGRVVVSDDQLQMDRYRQWAIGHRVYVLVNPNDVHDLSGAVDDARLDAYHELYRVTPP